MTELERARKELDALNATVKRLEEAEAKKPSLAKGQVWRHKESGYFVLWASNGINKYHAQVVYSPTHYASAGNFYSNFPDNLDAFEFVGMANDVLKVRLPVGTVSHKAGRYAE